MWVKGQLWLLKVQSWELLQSIFPLLRELWGIFPNLREKYGLLFNYSDSESALAKTIELLKDPELKKTWSLKRAALLRDKINVTEFMVKLIENLPEKKSGVSLSSVSDETYA